MTSNVGIRIKLYVQCSTGVLCMDFGLYAYAMTKKKYCALHELTYSTR